MGQKEHFYTREFYESAGLEPFLEHINQYLAHQRPIPVSKTGIEQNGHDILFTFSNSLMQSFTQNLNPMKKPYEVALKYGFRGYSRGGRNGIFYLRKSDASLLKAIPSLVEAHVEVIQDDLDISKDGLDALKNVKIVWHNPSGERIVGVYNQTNHRILFLDFAHY
ncbi:MAG: hypothetical protein Q8R18_02035 [bacterium]|nr:hypothetical protein [bacterium]